MLVSLALLLGLCTVVAPAFSWAGDRRPVSSLATAAAVPAADAHAVRRGFDVGAQPRLSWQRHTGGTSPFTAAALVTAAVFGGLLPSWWPDRRGQGGPAAGGRFARDSRAPPGGRLPSA
jgi:hypothetical protein